MIELKDITQSILFDDVAHTYTRLSDGKVLCGVTTLLRNMGLSADYGGIDEKVLQRAAERGKLVHALCNKTDIINEELTDFDVIDMYNSLREQGHISILEDETGMYEANEYLRLRKEQGLMPVTYEYLISDGENIASCIDEVYTTELLQKENAVILGDIKSTSTIHHLPLNWQLSIYKYLFELQNPGIKVAGIIGIWLPKRQYGEAKIFDAEEIAVNDVIRLIQCFANGEEFNPIAPIAPKQDNLLAPIQDLADVLRKIDVLKKRETEIREQMAQWMVENNVPIIEHDGVSVMYVPGTLSKRFDSRSFKADHKDLYEQYCKETMVKESIRVKIK